MSSYSGLIAVSNTDRRCLAISQANSCLYARWTEHTQVYIIGENIAPKFQMILSSLYRDLLFFWGKTYFSIMARVLYIQLHHNQNKGGLNT